MDVILKNKHLFLILGILIISSLFMNSLLKPKEFVVSFDVYPTSTQVLVNNNPIDGKEIKLKSGKYLVSFIYHGKKETRSIFVDRPLVIKFRFQVEIEKLLDDILKADNYKILITNKNEKIVYEKKNTILHITEEDETNNSYFESIYNYKTKEAKYKTAVSGDFKIIPSVPDESVVIPMSFVSPKQVVSMVKNSSFGERKGNVYKYYSSDGSEIFVYLNKTADQIKYINIPKKEITLTVESLEFN